MNSKCLSGNGNQRSLFKIACYCVADRNEDSSKVISPKPFNPIANNRRGFCAGCFEERVEVSIEGDDYAVLIGGIPDDSLVGSSCKANLADVDDVPPRLPEDTGSRSG